MRQPAKGRKTWNLTRSARRVELPGEVFALVIKQDGNKCAICGARATVNDHCHRRHRHRGRLCQHCNLAIGHMDDSPTRLRWAARYLEEFEDQFE